MNLNENSMPWKMDVTSIGALIHTHTHTMHEIFFRKSAFSADNSGHLFTILPALIYGINSYEKWQCSTSDRERKRTLNVYKFAMLHIFQSSRNGQCHDPPTHTQQLHPDQCCNMAKINRYNMTLFSIVFDNIFHWLFHFSCPWWQKRIHVAIVFIFVY